MKLVVEFWKKMDYAVDFVLTHCATYLEEITRKESEDQLCLYKSLETILQK